MMSVLQIVAGLRLHVPRAEMEGRRVATILNLKTARLAGHASQGMILAAVQKGEEYSNGELVHPVCVPGTRTSLPTGFHWKVLNIFLQSIACLCFKIVMLSCSMDCRYPSTLSCDAIVVKQGMQKYTYNHAEVQSHLYYAWCSEWSHTWLQKHHSQEIQYTSKGATLCQHFQRSSGNGPKSCLNCGCMIIKHTLRSVSLRLRQVPSQQIQAYLTVQQSVDSTLGGWCSSWSIVALVQPCSLGLTMSAQWWSSM